MSKKNLIDDAPSTECCHIKYCSPFRKTMQVHCNSKTLFPAASKSIILIRHLEWAFHTFEIENTYCIYVIICTWLSSYSQNSYLSITNCMLFGQLMSSTLLLSPWRSVMCCVYAGQCWRGPGQGAGLHPSSDDSHMHQCYYRYC